MLTQQDIYVAGSENRPPMLNKDNYVSWSSRLLRYAKSKPNGKLLVNSIKNGPYVRRMIHEPGDPNNKPPIAESTHKMTDDELTEKKVKQMEADDQAIQGSSIGDQKKMDAGNQNGLVVPWIANQNANQNRNGNVIAARVEGDIDEIEEMDQLSVEHNGGIVEQHPTTIEETRAYFESLYNNLVTEVKKVNTVYRKMKEMNANLTIELPRYIGQEKSFEINKAKFDELETGYRKSVYQEQCLTKKINALHLSSAKRITTLNEEIANLNNQLSKEKSIVSTLQEERRKLKDDFKTCEDELLDKLIQYEKKIKELDNILVKTGQSIQMMHMLSPKLDSFYHTE
ncbi:hypothetical protein Tco_1156944 [Tanacetum coccineum]